YNSPAATTPWGMVRLGPDTASMLVDIRGLNSSGYFYGDNKIIGFSHNRLLGADAFDGGNFRIFPTIESRVEKLRSADRSTPFSHKEEIAFPGYYAVRLPSEQTLVELTASTRVGFHRYTFSGNENPHLLIDVSSSLGDARTKEGKVRIVPASQEIEGLIVNFGSFSGRYGGLNVFFVARFNRPFAEYGTWSADGFESGREEAEGDSLGADVAFEGENVETVVEVRLALSHVSIENARLNLDTEIGDDRNFEQVLEEAKQAWEEKLSLIEVEGGTEAQQRIFYTALYRTLQMPTLFNDVNGEYLGFDKQIHVAEGFQYYTDFSLWDTFRTVHPLYNLIVPEVQRDMLVSMVEMAKAGGCFPRWPSGAGYTNCMIGTPADIMVTESYLKGIRDFDVETAYSKMRQTALDGKPEGTKFAGRGGLESYLNLGWCASEKMSKALGKTFEYSYADWALASLAKALNHPEDA
ncbi:MAG: GH92 family glycosyl hydrolase, partial [Candidatus Omnitrophica bacterium]|nr:GH92 family glycosyl hydrolase [Candidatus Omnitrophota bacterium]